MIKDMIQNTVANDYRLWNIEFGASWFLEFPTDELKKLLPPKLEIFESRPQIGLLCATIFAFKEGHLHCKPASCELTLSVQVIPKYALLKQLPKYALFVFRGAADTPEFLSHEYNIDKIPFESRPCSFTIDSSNSRVQIKDADSKLILDLKGPSITGSFSNQENGYQFFTFQNNKLYGGHVKMKNSLSINQELKEDFGQLFSHPIFQGLDITKMEDCFMHMVTENGNAGGEYFSPAREIL